MLVTETEEFEKTQAVQSKLKRSIGNVLPTSSGGNNLSLISGNPFSYSQLGSLGTNLINDALSKSKIKLDKFQTNDMFRASLEQQQRKLIEEAKQSLAAQMLKAGEAIEKARNQFLKELQQKQTSDMFRASLEQQQRKLIEEAKQSLAAQIQNAIKRSLSPDKNY